MWLELGGRRQCRWREVERSQMLLEAELTRLADGFIRG